MSDPTTTKSDSDISSNSSWDVINESDNSTSNSLENLFDERNCDIQNVISEIYKDVDKNTFITIPDEESGNGTRSSPADGKSGAKRSNSKSPKEKGKRKSIVKPLSSLSIIASILTLTGISLLCLLFPISGGTEGMRELEKEYSAILHEVSTGSDKNQNGSPEIFNLLQRDDILQNIQQIITNNDSMGEEEMCMIEDEYENITTIDDQFVLPHPPDDVAANKVGPFEESTTKAAKPERMSDLDLQNKTTSLISGLRKNLLNPRFHILLCTILKDLYLLKMIRDLEGTRGTGQIPNIINDKKTNNKSKKADGGFGKKKEIPKKMKQKNLTNKPESNRKTKNGKKNGITPITNTTAAKSSNDYPQPYVPFNKEVFPNNRIEKPHNPDDENGKSECERRFQELDFRWESIGESHRQKVQEIKEKFKIELHQLREDEIEFPARNERMKRIRDKYIQHLKNDRERYLYHLRRLRDERHKIMKDICLKKKMILNSKDASVGNYAILLPETYNFQQKLDNIKKRENTKQLDTYTVTSYFGPMPPISLDRLKVFNENISSPSILEAKNRTLDPLNDTLRKYHLERMKNYYEKKDAYSLRKANSSGKTYGIENTTSPVDSEGNANNIPLSTSVLDRDHFSNTGIDKPVIEWTHDDEYQSVSDTDPLLGYNPLEIKRKRKQNKKDIYDVAFDGNGEKIKRADLNRQNQFKNHSPSRYQLLTKQDPLISRKVISFKGRL
ncbi:hypothetical protein JTB14_022587 [Gonioctena quinquepunctata]|nr:hypothetical protein JTB14_022587 [Gonioctena quinquepunctata]